MGKEKERGVRRAGSLAIKTIPLLALPLGASELLYMRARRTGEKRGYELRRLKLRMRDGIRLSVNLYVPKGEGPFPAIVMVHSWALNRWQCHLYAPMFASDGYVVLAYDCRGWGTSGGRVQCADPDHEIADLLEVIDWLTGGSGLPVKADSVGVTGISYGGGHSFLVGKLDGKVKAVAPMNGWTDLAWSLVPQGSLKIFWGAFLILTASWATRLDPRNLLYRWVYHLLRGTEAQSDFPDEAQRRSVGREAGSFSTPAFIVAAWNDDLFEPNQLLDFYSSLQAPKMLYVGNGFHASDTLPGPRWAGKEIWEMTKRWFDYWLKGVDNGIMDEPRVWIYRPWKRMAEPEEGWPPPGVEEHLVYPGIVDGKLRLGSIMPEEEREMEIAPHPLCPVDSGPPMIRPQAWGGKVLGPREERGKGYVSFTTRPSPGHFELLGTPRLRVTLRPQEGRLQVNAFLYDVPPDGGRPVLITYGTATLRNAEVGKRITLEVEMVAADYLMKPGHRFRLAFSAVNRTCFMPLLGRGYRLVVGRDATELRMPLRRL